MPEYRHAGWRTVAFPLRASARWPIGATAPVRDLFHPPPGSLRRGGGRKTAMWAVWQEPVTTLWRLVMELTIDERLILTRAHRMLIEIYTHDEASDRLTVEAIDAAGAVLKVIRRYEWEQNHRHDK